MNPKINIIIPTWNTAKVTIKCIDSIKRHLPPNFAEIILVDNGSTDKTKDLLSDRSDITYIRNPTNLGFSKANNIGAKKARSQYLLFLNSDMELVDDKIVDMVKLYINKPDCGLIGPQLLNTDMSIQGSIFPDQSPINAIKQYWFDQNSYSKYFAEGITPIAVWAISGGAILISKKLFFEVGGWDEKYFMYFEDLDLCRKIRNMGKSIYYYPLCKIIHQHGVSGQKVTDSLNQWRRLIPSSKIYNGIIIHYILFFITWSARQWQKIFPSKN